MKKSLYLALAAVTLTLFACNSKPAESAQQAEEQMEQVAPEVFPAEAEEAPVAEADESLAEGSGDLSGCVCHSPIYASKNPQKKKSTRCRITLRYPHAPSRSYFNS